MARPGNWRSNEVATHNARPRDDGLGAAPQHLSRSAAALLEPKGLCGAKSRGFPGGTAECVDEACLSVAFASAEEAKLHQGSRKGVTRVPPLRLVFFVHVAIGHGGYRRFRPEPRRDESDGAYAFCSLSGRTRFKCPLIHSGRRKQTPFRLWSSPASSRSSSSPSKHRGEGQ